MFLLPTIVSHVLCPTDDGTVNQLPFQELSACLLFSSRGGRKTARSCSPHPKTLWQRATRAHRLLSRRQSLHFWEIGPCASRCSSWGCEWLRELRRFP